MDTRLRSLERASAGGDVHARLLLLKQRARSGELDRTAACLLERCVAEDGSVEEASLEVLDLAMSRELTHGSWVKVYEHLNGERGGLLKHSKGEWWAVIHWYTTWHTRECPDLSWMRHWALCPAGVPRLGSRRGFNRWCRGPRDGRVYTLEDGLDYLAGYLAETYRPGVGSRIWELRRSLPAAKGLVTRLENERGVGPSAWARLREARENLASIEAELKELEA